MATRCCWAGLSLDDIFSILDLEDHLPDAPNAREVKSVRGHVRFEGVKFHYEHVGCPILDGVDLEVRRGEALGLVGESGCGKSTLARLITALLPVTAGQIWFDGQEITKLRGGALRRVRRKMQMIFQDPFASLDPRMTVGDIIQEPLDNYGIGNVRERQKHHVEISLTRAYPRQAPQCRMLTPVFHPNIAPHAICVGDHWAASETLNALVSRIGEILSFQSYNLKSPLNGEAARWVEQNEDKIPLDDFDFSTLVVPTKTGCPRSWNSMISLMTAVNFSRSVL